MKVGKPHLIGSVGLLCGAVAYNAWMFMGAGQTAPSAVSTPVAAPPPAAPVASDAESTIDPSGSEALPDVAMGLPPIWTRDPFHDTRSREAVVEVVRDVPPPVPETPLVVASILHAPDRRLAMINGRVVRVGDVLGTTTIVDILPGAVIVDSPSGRRRIPLRTASAGQTP